MKKINLIAQVLVILFLGYHTTFSQVMNIQKFIGKSPQDLIDAIGQPVTFDKNNPSKIIIAYNLLSLKCLADQNGIYEAQLTKNYTSELEAVDEINELISNLINEGCIKDSLSEHHYNLYKPGIKTEIILTESDDSPKMELRVKAIKQTK
jgi:hypothetical protein